MFCCSVVLRQQSLESMRDGHAKCCYSFSDHVVSLDKTRGKVEEKRKLIRSRLSNPVESKHHELTQGM